MSEIQQHLPHREPFLFVDRILERHQDRIVTLRRIRLDEYFFQGHYPGNPIVPGVILCEAMYQTGAILMNTQEGFQASEKALPVVTRSQNVRYRRVVRPGDKLVIEVRFLEKIAHAYRFQGYVRVDGRIAASCEFICTMLPEEKQ